VVASAAARPRDGLAQKTVTAVDNDSLSTVIALVSFGLLIYTYALYPGLLWLLSLLPRAAQAEQGELTEWPHVSIVVSAYNEEPIIAERMQNLIELEYPRGRLEILVGSDGSEDRTCEIVRGYETHGIRLVAFQQRRGKAAVLNDLVPQARGELVVLTDANTFFHRDAVRELVSALWRHPSACAVVGRLNLQSSAAAGNLDGIYWRYETWIKTAESRFGCVLGAHGPIYAFRHERYQPLPPGAIVDDFLIPMLMRLHSGGQVLFVPTARAWERSPERVRDEFRRRVRIGAGDIQALIWTWPLLLPWKGMVAVAYFSHKILRWLGPWLMLLGLAANLTLLGRPAFQLLLLGQTVFYGLGLGAALLHRVPILGAAASAVRYFLVLNAALLLGFARFAVGAARPYWRTAPR
jgi:cellulose synthase/poly-beta-1,6-N-acetylglucosamine synthase-like glycosyltransferase